MRGAGLTAPPASSRRAHFHTWTPHPGEAAVAPESLLRRVVPGSAAPQFRARGDTME